MAQIIDFTNAKKLRNAKFQNVEIAQVEKTKQTNSQSAEKIKKLCKNMYYSDFEALVDSWSEYLSEEEVEEWLDRFATSSFMEELNVFENTIKERILNDYERCGS